MFFVRDLPTYESIQDRLGRYPGLDAASLESFLAMLRSASDVMSAWDRFLKTYQLSIGTFSVLMLLNQKPELPQTPSQLAWRCGVTKATMSGLLATLGRRRLIARRTSTVDRRTTHILLTPNAIRLLDGQGGETGLAWDYYGRIEKLMNGLSEPDLRRLTAVLLDIGARAGVFGRDQKPGQGEEENANTKARSREGRREEIEGKSEPGRVGPVKG